MVNKRQIEQEFFNTAPPPPQPAPDPSPRAFIGTTNAALFGVDGPKSIVVIDIKNFGQTPATDVRWRALAGYFVAPPENAEGGREGAIGITEPGHEQNIKLILSRPVTTDQIRQFERGGAGLYALAEIDYADVNGERHRRRIAYYCDPEGVGEPGKRMLDICPSGNEEVSGEAAKRPWYEERTRFTIREAGCLAAKVGPTEFEKSDLAHSKASELRYYVTRGRIPVAGEPPGILAARRGAISTGSSLPEVTLDTYVTKCDLEHFLHKPLSVWLDVQDEAHWRDPNARPS
jgi:hypothetical protein